MCLVSLIGAEMIPVVAGDVTDVTQMEHTAKRKHLSPGSLGRRRASLFVAMSTASRPEALRRGLPLDPICLFKLSLLSSAAFSVDVNSNGAAGTVDYDFLIRRTRDHHLEAKAISFDG